MNTLLKNDLQGLRVAIYNVKDLPGSKFNYALLVNDDRLEAEIKKIEASKGKLSAEATAYLQAKQDITESLACRDTEGNFITETLPGGRVIHTFDDQPAFLVAIKSVDEKHPDEIAEIARIENDFNDLLNSPADLVFHMIKQTDLPDGITGAQMKPLMVMIETNN